MKVSLFLLCCLCLSYCYSQTADKSINNFKKLTFKNVDTAMAVASDALYKATQNSDNKALADACNTLGLLYTYKGQLDSSIIFFERAAAIFISIKSDSGIARIYINLANVYARQFKINKALQYLIRADSLSGTSKNKSLQADVKWSLGIVYKNNEDYIKAASYFKEAQEAFSSLEDFSSYISTGCSLSMAYRLLNQYDSSLYILQHCLSIFTREQLKDMYLYAELQENIGDTYLDMDQHNEAIKYFTVALKQFTTFNSTIDIAYEEYSIGRTLAEMNRFREAETHLFRSYKVNDSLKNYKYLVWISNCLTAMYVREGNWQNAYAYLEKRIAWRDTIDIVNQIEQTNILKEKYETEKKEHEITLLKAKNQLSEANNKRNSLLQYIFIILFAAAVIIGWLLTNRIRIKRKLDQQLLRNRIASDLHDDIGSVLSSIDISSRIALVKNNDPAAVAEQIAKIRVQARKSMDNMSDIVWSINPLNDNFESMLARMKEFASEISEAQQIQLNFNEHNTAGLDISDPEIRKNIFLIFKEAVNNTCKYSGCKVLEINFNKTGNNKLQMQIQDNGTGFDEEKIKKGNGLTNMRLRAANIGAEIFIKSVKGEGTLLELSCTL